MSVELYLNMYMCIADLYIFGFIGTYIYIYIYTYIYMCVCVCVCVCVCADRNPLGERNNCFPKEHSMFYKCNRTSINLKEFM